jgi:hypothetical protein
MFTTFEPPFTNHVLISNSIFFPDFEPFSTNYLGVDILWSNDGSNSVPTTIKICCFFPSS